MFSLFYFFSSNKANKEKLNDTNKEINEYKSVYIKGVGSWFPFGPSSKYDTTYPKELENAISEKAFEEEMRRINRFAAMFFTCGVSLIFPRICIDDCLYFCNEELNRLNQHPESVKKDITWTMHNGFFSSYIEIRYSLHPTNKYPKDSIYYKNLDD